MILHRGSKESDPLPIGTVPRVTATVLHLADDGETIRIEYQIVGKRQRRSRIITEDELDRGTWAAKVGQPRPNSADARQAFATVMRQDSEQAPEVQARAYYTEDGDLVVPDAEAQAFGYRTLGGTEEQAVQAWTEIGMWAALDPKTALTLGAVFVGPVVDALDVLAHILNLTGRGQQGKSTALTVAAALLGDVKPRRQKLMRTWNASKQGITQDLRNRGFLPLILDEHSSSGRSVQESSREFSQIVAGAMRAMGTADGSMRDVDGFWHSVLLSSSNDSLKFEGQSEDLASRLMELPAPFFTNAWVDANGQAVASKAGGAEHVSKRLKRLARSAGGWPLEWAVRRGVFRAENLRKLKQLHLELCARYAPRQGGIPDTISELYLAWVVGACLLGEMIDMPEVGKAAEQAAAELVGAAILQAAETNLPDGERLWAALDALRIEASAYPPLDKLPAVAEEGFRKVRGFTDRENGQWWVINPVVKQAATEAGVDNLTAALRHLDDLGVHIRGTGKNAQRLLPKSIRYAGLGERMHCFDTAKAAELFAAEEESAGGPERPGATEFPCGATPGATPGATQVAPASPPLTWGGATGATGATLSLTDFSHVGGATPVAPAQTAPAAVGDGGAVSWSRDVTPYPAPVAKVTDPEWAKLSGWATSVGVLGAGLLHLPNCEPVPVVMPGSVDAVPGLMAAYGLRTLYLHAEALAVLGLPADRQARAALAGAQAQEADADGQPVEQGKRARRAIVGPQEPVEHAWATPGLDSPVREAQPAGLVAWSVLVLQDGSRVNVAVPAYDARIRSGVELGGLGGAPDPATMLDALMVHTLSTAYGSAESPKVTPYYRSPNKTAVAVAKAGRIADEDVLCEAIRRSQVPPALRGVVPTIVKGAWHRDLTEEERGRAWAHKFDKSAAWLGAYSAVRLGIGEPVHAERGRAFDKTVPGYWRVAEVPGAGDPSLPPLQYGQAPEGGFWLRTPGLELLTQDVYPGWEPEVLEAWWWPEQKRALNAMYTRLHTSRTRILAAIEEGRPGGKWAKQINGQLYKSFRGYLERKNPLLDFETGDLYSGDVFWRPDWAQHLLDLAVANTYRNLLAFQADGATPMSLYVDAITIASDQEDPELARPASMKPGPTNGGWTTEGSAPMELLLPRLIGDTGMHAAMRDHLKES
ncbi:DUF927 domain-containing protein [Kitasatospora acidiphila]|uniref:DUF927 domain-containing protein n=1 Tax=Kitasatospora acidiphila TaxID=2567942 RepID=UPI003C73DE84